MAFSIIMLYYDTIMIIFVTIGYIFLSITQNSFYIKFKIILFYIFIFVKMPLSGNIFTHFYLIIILFFINCIQFRIFS